MYNSGTEILFPLRLAGTLTDMRDDRWRELIQRLTGGQASREEKIAFIVMMIRVNGCIGCSADSYRAMRGCEACARQAIRRYKNSDQELLNLYDQAKVEVERHFNRKHNR